MIVLQVGPPSPTNGDALETFRYLYRAFQKAPLWVLLNQRARVQWARRLASHYQPYVWSVSEIDEIVVTVEREIIPQCVDDAMHKFVARYRRT